MTTTPTRPPRPQPPPGGDDDEIHAERLRAVAEQIAAGRRYQHARNALARYYGLDPAPSWDHLTRNDQALILAGLAAARRLWLETRRRGD